MLTRRDRIVICPREGIGRAVHRWPVPGAAARAGAASTILISRINPVRNREGVLPRKNVMPAHRPPSRSASMPTVLPLGVLTTFA